MQAAPTDWPGQWFRRPGSDGAYNWYVTNGGEDEKSTQGTLSFLTPPVP